VHIIPVKPTDIDLINPASASILDFAGKSDFIARQVGWGKAIPIAVGHLALPRSIRVHFPDLPGCCVIFLPGEEYLCAIEGDAWVGRPKEVRCEIRGPTASHFKANNPAALGESLG
jgi:hypothetical protein